MSEGFEFLDPGSLRDGELSLKLIGTHLHHPAGGEVPWYQFDMRTGPEPGTVAGQITFRAVTTPIVERYVGHIGYRVDEPFRGRHYAERATRLLLPFIRQHGLTMLWITCDPDNLASRRTCERLGGQLVEIVAVPPDTPMYRAGSRQKCRYRFEL